MLNDLYEAVSNDIFIVSLLPALIAALIAVAVSHVLNWRMNLREREWREITSIIEAISAYCSELENVTMAYWSKDKRPDNEDEMTAMEVKIRTTFDHIAHFRAKFHRKTFTYSDISHEVYRNLFREVMGGGYAVNERNKDLNRILSITKAIIRFRSFFYDNRESGSKK